MSVLLNLLKNFFLRRAFQNPFAGFSCCP